VGSRWGAVLYSQVGLYYCISSRSIVLSWRQLSVSWCVVIASSRGNVTVFLNKGLYHHYYRVFEFSSLWQWRPTWGRRSRDINYKSTLIPCQPTLNTGFLRILIILIIIPPCALCQVHQHQGPNNKGEASMCLLHRCLNPQHNQEIAVSGSTPCSHCPGREHGS